MNKKIENETDNRLLTALKSIMAAVNRRTGADVRSIAVTEDSGRIFIAISAYPKVGEAEWKIFKISAIYVIDKGVTDVKMSCEKANQQVQAMSDVTSWLRNEIAVFIDCLLDALDMETSKGSGRYREYDIALFDVLQGINANEDVFIYAKQEKGFVLKTGIQRGLIYTISGKRGKYFDENVIKFNIEKKHSTK